MSSNDSRPPTPDPVARQLRQEAGFGCCKCGLPIFQDHHIVPWKKEHHFRPEDMMVLCPNHHDEATRGAMLEGEQRRYKAQPYNLSRGYAQGMLTINSDQLAVAMGSNTFVGGGPLVKVDGELLVALDANEHGGIELTVRLYDERDNLLVNITRNEWVSGDVLPWDVEASYQKLCIRSRKGLVSLSLDCSQPTVKFTGSLWRKAKLIHVAPSLIRVDQRELKWKFSGCKFVGSYIALHTIPVPHVTIEPGIVI